MPGRSTGGDRAVRSARRARRRPFAGCIAIQHEQCNLAVDRIVRSHHIQEGHLIVAREIRPQAFGVNRVRLRGHLQIQDPPVRILQCPGIWVVDGLPVGLLRVGYEWRDHIDNLGETAQAHPIGVAQQRVDEAADEKRVLQVVLLLQ